MSDVPATWDSWTDVLGQTIIPGDRVAIAIINGRSPQMVIAEVVQINRVDSKGKPLEEVKHERYRDDEGRWQYKRESVPSCTFRCIPLLDARGFYRSGVPNWYDSDVEPTAPRAVTYKIPQNVIKLPDAP